MLSVYHMTAFAIGFVMDLLFGDPYWLPHPIRWIGRLIGWLIESCLERQMARVRMKPPRRKRKGGLWCSCFFRYSFLRQLSFCGVSIHLWQGLLQRAS